MEKELELVHIIPIFYEPLFLEHICNGQYKCMEPWYLQLAEAANMATNISMQFHDGVLYNLVGNYFAPVIPNSETLVQVIF